MRAVDEGPSIGRNTPRVSRKIPTTLNTYAIIDGIEPPTPLCHIHFDSRNGIIKRCGNGSQTVPNCSNPGVCESKTRRAMLMCATASPYSRISPRWK